jgi:flagellar biosynthesis component FlhA
LHIPSISVFVEFVCFLVQLLLVTCVSSLFHLTLAVTPTVTPPPLGFPSLSRGAVGQKKEKKRKKGKQSKKKEQKKRERESERKERLPHSPSGKREPLRLGARVLRRHNSPPIRPC